jgi:hypothetical protein
MLFLPGLIYISLDNTNRNAVLALAQKQDSYRFQQMSCHPYSPSLALFDFALFEWNNNRLVARTSETEDDELAPRKDVASSMSGDARIKVFKERIERLQTYVRRNGDYVDYRTFFFLAREYVGSRVPRFQVIMKRPITAVSHIDSSVDDIGEPLDELETCLIAIESRINDGTIDLTVAADLSHESDEKSILVPWT